MENYTKVVLYAYPMLKTVGEDYAEHIKNKALLSYDSSLSTEKLAEYLAEEILRKRKLEWLKGKIEEVLARLDDVERTLVAIRYFGKKRKIKKFRFTSEKNPLVDSARGERAYFRRQQRLSEKVGAMLKSVGITEDIYLRDYATLEIFAKIHTFVHEGKDRKVSQDERRWIR